MADTRLRELSEHDWARISALFPDAPVTNREREGFREFTRFVQKHTEQNHTPVYGDMPPNIIHSEVAGILAGAAILAYRRYLEELEALDRMQQHFEAVVADSVEAEE